MTLPTRQTIASAHASDTQGQPSMALAGRGDVGYKLATVIANSSPGRIHFIITPLESRNDDVQQHVLSLLEERMDHFVHIRCANRDRGELLDEITEAIDDLATRSGCGLLQAIVCTDLPVGVGEYRARLTAILDDVRTMGAIMVASVAPGAERMLSSMGDHERYYALEYCGPQPPTPTVLERRALAEREPLDLFASLCLPALLSVEEVSKITHVSPAQVRRLIRRGELEGTVYIGNQPRVHTAALLGQFGISVKEALPMLVDPIDYLFRAYVDIDYPQPATDSEE